LGRKRAVVFSIACYGLFSVLTGQMPTWFGVVICRFLTGFGFGGVLVATTTLMMEEWPEKTRAIFLGILSISIPVGIFSAGVIDYLVADWRHGFWIGILPLLISFLAAFVLKESDKWSASRHAVVNQESFDARLFGPRHRVNLVMGSLIFGSMLIGLWAIFSWLPT
jgi:MFS family permease